MQPMHEQRPYLRGHTDDLPALSRAELVPLDILREVYKRMPEAETRHVDEHLATIRVFAEGTVEKERVLARVGKSIGGEEMEKRFTEIAVAACLAIVRMRQLGISQ